MSRRMSCALTIDAVNARTKTVTRRHVDTWRNLKPGDRLTLIEKGMGLRKGERQVVLADVEIIAVTLERLTDITAVEIAAEGFDTRLWSPAVWAAWWAGGHGYQPEDVDQIVVRRIEWRYL